ncbi:MAG: N-6 DNA methylase [Bdellovibrionales bacterium]|nr:N-6 DNA methylase [Bdellovibrionales bacterium]
MEELSSFYIIYPLNLVDFGLSELKEKWSIHFPDSELSILSVDDGGILISVKTLQGFMLNHLLRTPTRILLRVAEFKARDFPKLFQKISKLSLKNLMIGGTPKIEVAATNSRLFDSRKIEKAIHDGLLESYRKQPVKKKYLDHYELHKNEDQPKIYYRAVDDVITISLDTTGELLHKRGEKTFTGLAPIRESLAAILLRATTQNLQGAYTLIDPMSGSGTFLIEAHDTFKTNFDRPFSYQHTPLWIDYALKNKIQDQFQSQPNSLFKEYLGLEINEDVILMSKKNSANKDIVIKKGDIFDGTTFDLENTVVIINPPYGHRVGEKDQISLSYYEKIINKVWSKFKPIRLGIIIPEEYNYRPKSSEIVNVIPFKNGGLAVVFYVLKK